MKKIMLLLLLLPVLAKAQNIFTVAGTIYGYSGDGGPATAAKLGDPFDVALDAAGNFYIADADNNVIRKVNTAGIITTFAGNHTPGFSGDGGQATAAQLTNPQGVCVDAAGNVYISDHGNNRVRMVSSSGIITTIAGNGSVGSAGDFGPATAAQLNQIAGIAVNSLGFLAIADQNNERVRLVTPTGFIGTIAGIGSSTFSGDGGPATAAALTTPSGVAFDTAGNLFISDAGNNRIRKVNTMGIISTVAGTGSSTYAGDGVPATTTPIAPQKVDVDRAGNIFIADGPNSRIRMVNTSGIISTVAGNGMTGFAGDGGPATAARFSFAAGVRVDTAGSIFIVDQMNNRIRRVLPAITLHASHLSAANDIQLFPNPNKGTFTIIGSLGSAADETVTIEITNLSGQPVYKDHVLKTNGKLYKQIEPAGKLPNGIYTLTVSSGSEHKVFHLVIEQ
jgi:trimeric autotransporter adhesin